MGQLKVYHFKTLWVTYLVWAVLVALAAARIVQVGNLPNARQGLLFWLLIHMGPLLPMCYGDPFSGLYLVIAGLPILATAAGLFVRSSGGTILVAFGISVWFFWGLMFAGIGVT